MGKMKYRIYRIFNNIIILLLVFLLLIIQTIVDMLSVLHDIEYWTCYYNLINYFDNIYAPLKMGNIKDSYLILYESYAHYSKSSPLLLSKLLPEIRNHLAFMKFLFNELYSEIYKQNITLYITENLFNSISLTLFLYNYDIYSLKETYDLTIFYTSRKIIIITILITCLTRRILNYINKRN